MARYNFINKSQVLFDRRAKYDRTWLKLSLPIKHDNFSKTNIKNKKLSTYKLNKTDNTISENKKYTCNIDDNLQVKHGRSGIPAIVFKIMFVFALLQNITHQKF